VIAWRQRALALLAVLALAPEARAGVFEYLYVEANAGSSAGGHFALRLDDWVYDFQNAELGTLRMRRTDYDLFRYLYTVLENRTMHIARIDVPRETREAIFDRFNRRYLIQNKQFSMLDSLRGDRELIGLLLARGDQAISREGDRAPSRESDRATSPKGGRATSREGDRAMSTKDGRATSRAEDRMNSPEGAPTAPPESKSSGMPIRGAGFFYDGQSKDAGGESPSLRALRDRLVANHGETYLTDRIAALERAAEGLSPAPELASAAVVVRDVRPESGYHFSDRYRDLSAKIVALRTLENATRVRPSARRVPSGDEYALSAEEGRKIRAFAERLEIRLARLVSSKRPDWGYSLLLGMARLQTLRESLELERWVVLDSVPANPAFLSQRAVQRRDPFVVELRDRARVAFDEARGHFATAPEPVEPSLAWLEEAVNRYAAFQRGFELDLAIPLYEGGLLPDRAVTVRGLPLPDVDLRTLRRAAETAETRERDYLAAVKQAFGYQLVSNNCVTAIFATLGQESDPTAARDQPAEGGDSEGPFDFIPVVAYRKVLDAHADAEASEIPSFRRVRLETMYETENDLGVYLRESNTLTSTIYRRNDVEPFFLFFTEDALPLRPVYGALNFAAAIGEMALGVLRAPWDRGRMFTSGLKGATFSLPELFFVNLRKGILEYAPGDTPRTLRRPAQHAAFES
jgi:hypothetical protein